MATLVKLSPRRLSRHRRPERNKEHTPLGAKFLILPPGVPPLAEPLGRKNDPPPARKPQCVAAGLFARAHESGNARATRPEARSPRNDLTPLFATLNPLARTAERLQDRQFQKRRVAVAIPLAPKEIDWYCRKVGDDIRDLPFPPRLAAQCGADGLSTEKTLASFVAARRGGNEGLASIPNFATIPIDFVNPTKILRVAHAHKAAHRVLANVARKRRELLLAFDDPIMPIGEKHGGNPLSFLRLQNYAFCFLIARLRADLPISPRKRLHQPPQHRSSTFYPRS